MSLPRYWACLALLLATIAIGSAIVCPRSTCDIDDPNLPVTWLNTSSMAALLIGTSFTLYPMKRNGEAYLGAYSQINFTALQELQPEYGDGRQCHTDYISPDQEGTKSTVLHTLDWTQLCCDVVTDWDMLEPTINRTTVSVMATDPLNPDFLFKLSYSLVNQSVTYHTNGTEHTNSTGYDTVYSSEATKVNMELKNWPWVGSSLPSFATSPSFLKFYFIASGKLDEPGNVTGTIAPTFIAYNATSTKAFIGLNFLKIFTADGIDYLPTNWATTTEYPFVPDQEQFALPFALSTCVNKLTMDAPQAYFQNFSYDPTLTSLYDDPSAPDSSSQTPQQKAKKRLPVAAYAVPIALVVVGLAVAFVILFVTPVNQRVFPSKGLARNVSSGFSSDADHAPVQAPKPSASEAPDSSSPESSSWVRSTKIKH